jgi:hypothetical protein
VSQQDAAFRYIRAAPIEASPRRRSRGSTGRVPVRR